MAYRQGQLVSQHLENISRGVLEKYAKIIRAYVRRRHGVYALYRKKRLYYVGLASNLRSRLTTHLRDRHSLTWDRFSVYLTRSNEHLKELESLLLRIASPRGNKQKGRLARSQDLRREFRRKVASAQQTQLRALFFEVIQPPQVAKAGGKRGRRPTLARYVKKRLPIRFMYRGKRYVARGPSRWADPIPREAFHIPVDGGSRGYEETNAGVDRLEI